MSKDLFLEQREWEESPISKQTVNNQIYYVKTGLKSGTIEPKEAFIKAKIVADIAKEVIKEAQELIKDTDTSELPHNLSGVELSERSGHESLDYEKDPVYKELHGKLKEREKALKAAYEHSQRMSGVITDDNGEVIPVVPVKSVTKSSLIVKY